MSYDERRSLESQFHYGSIKTNANSLDFMLQANLNSTMVRLKLSNDNICYRKYLYLNSTMVRLKQSDWDEIIDVPFPSQFLYGSIKTPEKVRLERDERGSQFHYGSIKTGLQNIWLFSIIKSQFHYGSIKTIILTMMDGQHHLSQFHYGSIKTQRGKMVI